MNEYIMKITLIIRFNQTFYQINRKNSNKNTKMLNPKEFGEILSKHFTEVTPEQFVENLKKSGYQLVPTNQEYL